MATSSCTLTAVRTGITAKHSESAASSSSYYSSSLRVCTSGRTQRGRKLASEFVRCDAAPAAEDQLEQFDTKNFRKTLTRSNNYNKNGFGYKKEMLQQMDLEYTSECSVSSFPCLSNCIVELYFNDAES